jgi:hypothetical protein
MPGTNHDFREVRYSMRLAPILGVIFLSACAAPSEVGTLSGGAAFNRQDCSLSPISGLPFQACEVSPWVMGSGRATSGAFSARPDGIRPGLEGGVIDSEKIYAASFTDGTASVTVEYAIPRTSLGAFHETTSLNGSSLVGAMCNDIQEKPCKAGSPINDLRVSELNINGQSVRLEQFAVSNNPNFRSGFVAYIRGEPNQSRPGYRTSIVARGFLTGPDDARIASWLGSLKFQRFDIPS